MRKKFNSDDDLPSKKILELYNMTLVVRSVYHEGNKYFLMNVFINYKCNRINMSEEFDANKT